MQPTLRQLEYLVAVAEHRHFGRAARSVGVTQPGLSSQIKRLEGLLGQPLFERRPRGVLPTPAGVQAAARARHILAAVDELKAQVRAAGTPLSGPLRVGVIPTLAPYLLPRLLPALADEFPALRPFLYEDKTSELVASLEAGRLDVALLALPVDSEGLEARPLFEDPFLFVVPTAHRLAGRRRLEERDLAGELVLLLDEGHCFRDQALQLCGRAGAHEGAEFRGASLVTLVQMVAAGTGATLVPELALDSELGRARGLEAIAFAPPAPARTIGLVWRATSPRSAEFDRLAATLERAEVSSRASRSGS